jgi:tetratricopeptide (TPR) repeat protein
MSLLLDALQRASKDKALAHEANPVTGNSVADLSLVDEVQSGRPVTASDLNASQTLTLQPPPDSANLPKTDAVVTPAVEKVATQQSVRVAQDIRNAYKPVGSKGRWRRKVLLSVLAVWFAGLAALVLVLWNSPTVLESARTLLAGGQSEPSSDSNAMPMPMPMAVDPAAMSAEVTPAPAPEQTVTAPTVLEKVEAKPVEAKPAVAPKKLVAKPVSEPPPAPAPAIEQRVQVAEIDTTVRTNSVPSFVAKAKDASPLELGYAALIANDFNEAAKQYSLALKANPEERDALLGLAYIAQKKGLRDDAKGLYRRVLRQDPNNAIASSGLVALDSDGDVGQTSSRALDLASRQPDSAATMAVAGTAAARAGQLAEAVQLFARAQFLEPDNLVHAYNHAVALDRLGQFESALAQYGKVLQLSEKPGAQETRGYSMDAVRQRIQQIRQALRGSAETAK